MDDKFLRIADRVEIAVEIGESHFREFKSGHEGPSGQKIPLGWKHIAKKIGDTLVGFANADGGELLVGVEDDGEITGLELSDDDIRRLLDAPRTRVHKDTPLPSPRAHRVSYQGHKLLYFSVQKGTRYVYLTSDGRCLQRLDRDTVPVPSEHIMFSRREATSQKYDRAFIDGADIPDLDVALVTHVAERISKGMSVEKCLQHLELAEYDGNRLRLRRAALLLFAQDPAKWHPRLQVRIIKIDGTELGSGHTFNVTSDNEVTDNIVNLIEASWDLLRPHLTETRIAEDAVFRAQIIYPELACREALINAVAHRDNSIEGRGIEVHVYSDRLEVVSPGALLSSISLLDLQQLKGVHQSRNSLVARVLRELGYMRELGEGIRRIYELMSQNDLTEPDLSSDTTTFRIALHHRFIYPQEVKLWVDAFAEHELTRDEKTVVRLGYDGHVISPQEIWDAVGIVDTDYYRQLLESLREKNLLYRKISANKAFQVAKNKRTSKKRIPQFGIRNPSEAKRTQPDQEPTDTMEYAKVFVGNIPFDATEEAVSEAFRETGEVVEVAIPVNPQTERPRGFAFVEFATNEQASKALADTGRIQLGGRRLYIQQYTGRRTSGRARN